MVRLKRVFNTLDRRFGGLAIRLGWMALVVALIYAVQHTPLSNALQTALSEGIAVFGGVELILEKLNDIRRNREAVQLRKEADEAKQDAADARQETAKAEQKAAKAEQDADAAGQKAAKAEQDADELRLRVAELEEIVKNRPPQDDPEA